VKTCSKCGEEKLEEAFYAGRARCKACIRVEMKALYDADPEKHRARARQYGKKSIERRRRHYAANRERFVARGRAYHVANPEKVAQWNANAREKRKADPTYWKRHRVRSYGLTWEQYLALLAEQGNRCAICGGPPNSKDDEFHIDHDHSTNRNRGLLCGPCNVGIGMFRDDPELLTQAIAYLKRYAGSSAAV